MKNHKLEIILLVISLILIIANLIVALHRGITKAQIFIYSTDFILLLLWSYSIIKRRINK